MVMMLQRGITSLLCDITTLSNLTVITNAANTRRLGCFQPAHRCIDNVIHSRAGPRLREECFRLMDNGNRNLPVSDPVITAGYCLPAPYIIHTVGPQLDADQSSLGLAQRAQLAQCYRAVLDQVESLPISDEDGKTVALCSISIGLFAFPVDEAATLAVEAVIAGCASIQKWASRTSSSIPSARRTRSLTRDYSPLYLCPQFSTAADRGPPLTKHASGPAKQTPSSSAVARASPPPRDGTIPPPPSSRDMGS
ncbi:A1pp-domain-containing protein [Aspergillus saccharolyticus JOP 1030-1]|uniref:A1pp-domain-containing protein n=1 Tax=Aspergillus saccharolyticus JOP 1030-1 TaxID=1450539 RepID=A0A318Z1Z6_9EURO|nr:A1pp-domain-containing protein [Aspergillus saccharolyticus JOP 1030-1]PYH40414.1 A1pp-domain-containing protein [Aspergillus saccharolyticus JOP 1030-1]